MATKPELVVMYETAGDPRVQAIGWRAGVPGVSVPRMFVRMRSNTVLCYYGVPKAKYESTLASGDRVGQYLVSDVGPLFAKAHLEEGKDVVFSFKTYRRKKSKTVPQKMAFGRQAEPRWAW